MSGPNYPAIARWYEHTQLKERALDVMDTMPYGDLRGWKRGTHRDWVWLEERVDILIQDHFNGDSQAYYAAMIHCAQELNDLFGIQPTAWLLNIMNTMLLPKSVKQRKKK
jgi:hypothetical protein